MKATSHRQRDAPSGFRYLQACQILQQSWLSTDQWLEHNPGTPCMACLLPMACLVASKQSLLFSRNHPLLPSSLPPAPSLSVPLCWSSGVNVSLLLSDHCTVAGEGGQRGSSHLGQESHSCSEGAYSSGLSSWTRYATPPSLLPPQEVLN